MQLRGIDTNLIVALRALLVHRNVTRAGKEVGLSQSSMSHALSRLRAHFDDPLLVAVGRDLVLTERAKALVEPVSDAVARLERVFSRAEPFDPRTSRRVFRIAATDNLELFVLPRLAAILEKEAPQIDIRVCALPDDWMTGLQRGDIDLKLGRKYAVPATVESQDLSHERFTCVTRRGHPARRKLTVREYVSLDHLLIAPTAPPGVEPHGVIDAALEKQGLHRRIVMTVPHFLVAPFVVASSDLVLTAPTRLVSPFIKLLGLRELDLPVKLPGYKLSYAWAVRTRDDDAQRWLRATIARAFGGSRRHSP
ncbi:MAG: LysR family transcriptional regulator [Myxococcota bacterium]|nr:LysR family transcriptional regulator [Myxococcota bacterium]